MKEFKITNFCEYHNQEFKKYYNYLKNESIYLFFFKVIYSMKYSPFKEIVIQQLNKNKVKFIECLKKTDIIVKEYVKNGFFMSTELGHFYKYYLEKRVKINIQNEEDRIKLFFEIVSYPNFLQMIKNSFYIFSNYRACLFFMTPTIDFHKCKKTELIEYIKHFKDNLNTLTQVISKVYIFEKNQWGSKYYSTAYAMFETLMIIDKKIGEPLKRLGIKMTHKKKFTSKQIIINLCKKYHASKMFTSDLDNNINVGKINSMSHFLVVLKHLGYDMWFVIPLIFGCIYDKYKFANVPDSLVIEDGKNAVLQKRNNIIGIMCYLLVHNGFITNTNIFANFND